MTNFKNDFPILKRRFYDKTFTYLDSAATTQKPQQVIDAINYYYTHENANVHRGIYRLSEESTARFEAARRSVQHLLNAQKFCEIVFTSGTTESINLVAASFGQAFVNEGDEIIISAMEHHSNIVPWQLLCQRSGAKLKVIPIDDSGVLDLSAFKAMLNSRVKLVSIVHVSNVLGVVNPVKEIIDMAHGANIPVLLDGAQALPHMAVDVQSLDCDFYAFSSHKMYGPTGMGGLYAKERWLEQMPPYQGGGDMIRIVSYEASTYNELPHKFEAGTPNMAGAAGLDAAIQYLLSIGYDAITLFENELYHYAESQLAQVPGLRIIGEASQKAGALSFVMKDVHPHDLSSILDHEAIAIRAGHHCAMPLMNRLGLAATARVSFGVYNDKSDIDRLVAGLHKALALFVG